MRTVVCLLEERENQSMSKEFYATFLDWKTRSIPEAGKIFGNIKQALPFMHFLNSESTTTS